MSIFYSSGATAQRLTQMDEAVLAGKALAFQLLPTWGVSALRDASSITGTGATIAEGNGEMILSTGTTTAGVVQLQSLERGQCPLGSELECGVGVRIPTAPTVTQDLMWGYCDNFVTSGNGFGFGVDATNEYVFYRLNGVTTKVYQSSWNVDKVDGTGASALTLNYQNGAITQAVLAWDGYGTIQWFICVHDSTNNKKVRIEVHRTSLAGEIGPQDPNLPITVRAINGITSTNNVDLAIGGRQVLVMSSGSVPRIRSMCEFLSEYTVAGGDGVWEPVLAIRRKSLHGTSNRYNSVEAMLSNVEIQTDQPLEFKLSFGDTTAFTPVAVTSITRSGSTATVTTTAPHGFFDFDYVVIAGANETEYNGTFIIDSTGGSTFTYTVTGTPATPATGTITVGKTWGTPYESSATESAVEARKAVFTSTIGTVFRRGIAVATRAVNIAIPERESIPLGGQKELVLWVRRTTASTTIISAILTWSERW